MKNIKRHIVAFSILIMLFTQTVFADSLLPTGGSEWDYNPSIWNNKAGFNNCYQYAVLKSCCREEFYPLQPGDISGDPLTILSKSAIIIAVKKDLEGDIYETTKYAIPTNGYRKVALVIAPDRDYHWYEQNSDGYWSHKPGIAEVTNLDDSGNVISDPETCDRGDYTIFAGWFMVR
ncbi:hypothetical protein PV797_12540 [Clostridiaceae bacterium M8S5]|nr:hypothetical protein PV797_12540 [Clostridiaceae bacterium M8S5]